MRKITKGKLEEKRIQKHSWVLIQVKNGLKLGSKIEKENAERNE